MKRILLLAVLALISASSALAVETAKRPGADVGEAAYYYARVLLLKINRGDADQATATEAERWLRTAIRLGEGRAALLLADAMSKEALPCSPEPCGKTVADLRALGVALRKIQAEKGDVKVATEIGLTYLYKRYGLDSDEDALYWIERAARGGEPRAMLELARMLRYGAVKGRDPKESISLLEKAAAVRYATAVRELAEMYATGLIVPLDAARSLHYYLLGASYGSAESMRRAGLAYLSGFGTPPDAKKGVEFLTRAAGSGSAVAMFNLAMAYRSAPQGLTQDKAASLQWLKKAAQREQADALYLLGLAYRHGDGVAKDEKEARRLIAEAVKQGYFLAETDEER